MCGRTACTLAPHTVEAACRRLPVKDVKTTGDVDRYRRSHNTAPHQTTPVLIKQGDSLVVRYMRWGLLPSWYKGDIKSFKKTMINARKENLGHIKSFRRPLENKQRCVVLAEGFYEWKKAQGQKPQPFYVFFPPGSTQKPALEVPADGSDEDQSGVSSQIKTEEDVLKSSQDNPSPNPTTSPTSSTTSGSARSSASKSLPLMAFAGIYDVNYAGKRRAQPSGMASAAGVKKEEEEKGEEDVQRGHTQTADRAREQATGSDDGGSRDDEKPLYTYTVITVPASKDLEWLHDRMPAVLPTREAMMAWLDTSSTPLMTALQLLEPYNGLGYYPVSPKVGKISNTGADCRAPLRPKKPTNTLTRFLMPNATTATTRTMEKNTNKGAPSGSGSASSTTVRPPAPGHVPLVAAMMKQRDEAPAKRAHNDGGAAVGGMEREESCSNPSKAAKRAGMMHTTKQRNDYDAGDNNNNNDDDDDDDDVVVVVDGEEGGCSETVQGGKARSRDQSIKEEHKGQKGEEEEDMIVLE